jgi:hypothetical protein
MAKYRKHNNNVKKIKQASKDYGTERRSNMEENTNQMSRDNNSGCTDLKQSEVNAINSRSKKSEELNPLVVYDIATKDGITDADISMSTKKSVSVLPYDDKDEVMTSNPFQAAISLWQNYMSAWFRVWNEFFRYPTRRNWFFPS